MRGVTERLTPPAGTALAGTDGRVSPAWAGFLQLLCDRVNAAAAGVSAVGDVVISVTGDQGGKRSGDWLPCDGQLVGRDAYPALFAVLGTVHGAGNEMQFGLPNVPDTGWGGKAFIRAR